ncbi:unnamed protein product, partial [Medioppia subpectinata]
MWKLSTTSQTLKIGESLGLSDDDVDDDTQDDDFRRQRHHSIDLFAVSLFPVAHRSVRAAAAAEIGLSISPFAPSVHQPSHHQFVLTCKGFGAEPNLFSNLRWFDPRGEEITRTYSKATNADIRVEELQFGVILLHFLNPFPDNSGQYRCSATFQHS